MAELVDALVSGTSIRKDVQVRVLFRAQKQSESESKSDHTRSVFFTCTHTVKHHHLKHLDKNHVSLFSCINIFRLKTFFICENLANRDSYRNINN